MLTSWQKYELENQVQELSQEPDDYYGKFDRLSSAEQFVEILENEECPASTKVACFQSKYYVVGKE